MTRLRGRRLDQLTQADMEAIEARIELRELDRHLADHYGDDDEPPAEWDDQ